MQYRSKTTLLKAFFHSINFTPLFGAETERTPRDAKQVPFVDLCNAALVLLQVQSR